MARTGATRRKINPATFGSRTDIGCVREHNEDSLVVAPPLFAVADGMGGHAAGEVASEIAVRTLQACAPTTTDTQALSEAVEIANRQVIRASQDRGRQGMGCTLTACILEGEQIAIAQVGDSRAYLLHGGQLQQITRDHSLMADMIEAGRLTPEEARVHPDRSKITRALGSDASMRPDMYKLNVAAGDRILLCSDGLTSMLYDEEIEAILNRGYDPQRSASILVNEANAQGGLDNITVIVVDVVGNEPVRQAKERRKSHLSAIAFACVFVALVAGICWGGFTLTQQSAYLQEKDGKVAIYQGLPDSLAGITLSHLVEVTDISVDELPPGVEQRLKTSAVRVDDIEAARDLVDSYKDEINDTSKTSGK